MTCEACVRHEAEGTARNFLAAYPDVTPDVESRLVAISEFAHPYPDEEMLAYCCRLRQIYLSARR